MYAKGKKRKPIPLDMMVLVFFFIFERSNFILMHLNCTYLIIICYSCRFKVSGFST